MGPSGSHERWVETLATSADTPADATSPTETIGFAVATTTAGARRPISRLGMGVREGGTAGGWSGSATYGARGVSEGVNERAHGASPPCQCLTLRGEPRDDGIALLDDSALTCDLIL